MVGLEYESFTFLGLTMIHIGVPKEPCSTQHDVLHAILYDTIDKYVRSKLRA